MTTARRVSWARFRVTALVIAAVSILGVLFWLLTGGTLFQEKVNLYISVPDAIGVGPDTEVRVNGINVGKVIAVALYGSNDPNRVVRITLQMERDSLSEIPVDSSAQLSTLGPIGDKYVDITRGRSTMHIEAGAEISFRPQLELLKTLDLAQFEAQIRQVEALLADIEAGRNRVGQILTTDKMYNDIRDKVAGFDKIVRLTASTSSMVGQLVYTDALYRKINDPLMKVDRELARLQSGQGPYGGLLREDAQQWTALRQKIAGLRQSIASVRANAFLQSDDLYLAWNRSLGVWMQSVDEFSASPLLRTSEGYDNFNGLARELRDTVAEFRRDPQKFLRVKVF